MNSYVSNVSPYHIGSKVRHALNKAIGEVIEIRNGAMHVYFSDVAGSPMTGIYDARWFDHHHQTLEILTHEVSK